MYASILALAFAFALPSITAEETKRPVIGVQLSEVGSALAAQLGIESDEGVLVAGVVADGPAEAAGVKPFDVIVAVDGNGISSSNGLAAALKGKRAGDSIRLGLLRGGKPLDLSVRVAEADAVEPLIAKLAKRKADEFAGALANAGQLSEAARAELEIAHAQQAKELSRLRSSLDSLAAARGTLAHERAELERKLELEAARLAEHAELSEEQRAQYQQSIELYADGARKALEAARAKLELPEVEFGIGGDGTRFALALKQRAEAAEQVAKAQHDAAALALKAAYGAGKRSDSGAVETRLAAIEERLGRIEELLQQALAHKSKGPN